MAMNNPYQQYKNNAILTASPQELTLMLYDGALKFCNQAMKALEDGEKEKANLLIIRVEDIIQEFQSTLDDKYEVSQSFAVMYDYIYRRLIDANIGKDKTILEEAYELIKELRDTWKEAMQLSKRQSAGAAK